MNYTIDDILFGVMCYLATYHPTEKILYLSKKNFVKNKKQIKTLCGEISTQTLNNHLKKLVEKGLISEVERISEEEETPSYIFPKGTNNRFQLVENEMLWYVVSTRHQHAVKIYIYLLNKYDWKKKQGEEYVFTNKELLSAIGYSSYSYNNMANDIVNNILESFDREGVISYEEFYEEGCDESGKSFPIPRKKLLFVASSKKELKTK